MSNPGKQNEPPLSIGLPRTHRRRKRRRRRLVGAAVLLLPGLWVFAVDCLLRFRHIWGFDRDHTYAYVATVAASTLFWAMLLYAASRQRGILRDLCAGLFAVLFTLTVGVQTAFFGYYDIYLSHDGAIYARSLPKLMMGYLPLYEPWVLIQLVGTMVAGIVMLSLGRMWVKPRRIARNIAPLLIAPAMYGITEIPASYRAWQSTTPDIIYVHGIMSHIKVRRRLTDDAAELRVQRRDPVPVATLARNPARPRNVLFILQESLREDITCNAYVKDVRRGGVPVCATPFSNDAAPNRFAFLQMRANASTTAVSISNLWSGIPTYESYDTLLSVPLLWDYAEAAGIHSAYWTSQHVMFGSMRLYVQDFPVAQRAYATHLDKHANFDAGANDALLTDWAIDEWENLEEPFFAMVHYSNVHFPYVYDENDAPFQPAEFNKAAGKNEHFLNYYRNVAYTSDKAVGKLIDHVRSTDSGERTVIVYTSDHGESFREHWQMGHTSAIYDEEIKVPGWIDAPPGTLSDSEEKALRQAAEEFVWHYDLTPTVLDLFGVWDAPELAEHRAKMVGNPITRPERTTGPVPLTNCSWVWECGFRNWGLMQGHMKIEARGWDNEFHCFDLKNDPSESTNLGEDACAPLPDVARATFGQMPFQDWPIGKDVIWGPAPSTSASVAPP